MKHKVVGTLLAVTFAIGIVAAPAMSEGLTEAEGPGELVTEPISAGEPGEIGSVAASCSIGQQCVWSGHFTGQFSWWPESNTGCHNHAGNPALRSGTNNTSHQTRVGGWGFVGPYQKWWTEGGAVYGEICW